MSRWLGYDHVKVAAIVVDAADIKRRMSEPHVAELAADIREHGDEPIHAPTVRAGKKRRLLCGRDRVAASMLNKATKIWVHVVECDDREAEEIEVAENAYRRTENRSQLIARLVELKKAHLRATAELTQRQGGDTVPTSSEQTIASKAHREVARSVGSTVDAVRKAVKRERIRSHTKPFGDRPPPNEPLPAADAPEPSSLRAPVGASAALSDPLLKGLPAGFQVYGVDLPPARRADINATHVMMTQWLEHARNVDERVKFHMKHVVDQGGERTVGRIWLDGIARVAAELHLAIANAIPAALCGDCKGTRCKRCHDVGVVGRYGNEGMRITPGPAPMPTNGKSITVEVNGQSYTGEQLEALK